MLQKILKRNLKSFAFDDSFKNNDISISVNKTNDMSNDKICLKKDLNIRTTTLDSRDFEKIKAQNKLTSEHIKRIVDTYRNRTETERYSHLASLDEVRANDYNLNIPRYVNTFEEEEAIDIQATMKEIKLLEARRTELDEQIAVYLKELGVYEQQ